MPYIDAIRRVQLALKLESYPINSGELNYCLTELCRLYLDSKVQNYNTINDIVGALEGAKLEFYRRIAVPYEEKKINQNGDVY